MSANPKRLFGTLAAFGLLYLASGVTPLRAAEEAAPVSKVSTATMKKYEQTARDVFAKLVAHMPPIKDYEWDKLEMEIVDYVDSPKGKMYYNAVAWRKKVDNKMIPMISITRPFLEAYQGDEHGLALVLGHELGHHARGHCKRPVEFKAVPQANMDGHRREADADLFGARLMLKAGYLLRKAMRSSYKAMETMNGLYGSCYGTAKTHPGWTDRLARIAELVDSQEAKLWENMAAFENGVYFLSIYDYAMAESYFLLVTQEFPNCGEAWMNLGMARLLRHCDALSASDLSRLRIGQFVAGVRFGAAKSLTMRSGSNETLNAAVAALKKARDLMPQSAMVLVSLGVAALVENDGITAADKLFAEALAMAEDGTSDLDEPTKAALLLNRGVIRLARGNIVDGQAMIRQARALCRRMHPGVVQEMRSVIEFNMAAALSAEGKPLEAIKAFESYLESNSPSNPWWSIAYEQYSKLNDAVGETPRSRTSLSIGREKLRRQAAITLPSGKSIHLGERMAKVNAELGWPTSVTGFPRNGLRRQYYAQHGVVIFADDDEVFAIMIVASGGPDITVREAGPGGKVLGTIRIGMTRAVVESIPCGHWLMRPFMSMAQKYPYHAQLGVAIVYDSDKPDAKVLTILIGSIPTDGDDVKLD